ncbi:hypothetical protein DMUE_6350, partial [Dictyocoela muelleri]
MTKKSKEKFYSQILPRHVPKKSFIIHFINACTMAEELTQLEIIIQQAKHFVLDTESDIRSHTPALIQVLVLVLSTDTNPSSLLLIEAMFLPQSTSWSFHLIQKLFIHLFRKDTYLYSWGPLVKELQQFERHQLGSHSSHSNFIDVQLIFTKWFNSFLMDN